MIIGIILVTFSQVTFIGYSLYQWGALDISLGTSLWNAFILWGKMVGGGIVSVISALFFPEK